jgi:predicted DNA-binding protein YlxM (UPF0122 family)
MAYSDEQWDLVKSYYEANLSLSEIIDRDGVVIKSKSQISKKAKVDGWIKGKNEQLILENVQLKQKDIEIKKQKETLKETELSVVNEIVDERTKHLTLFNNAAIRNQNLANIIIEEKNKKKGEDGLTLYDVESHSRITSRNKETVLGKSPDTAIQINNVIDDGSHEW